ncbi:clavesin-1-like [Daktulosphaira vitifoliae]|uniref:clavesin-1-like n=1 Tax=Daktulosphaira vitifoliae TaxID=58002 RepID=UPI0021A9F419|nr:clavesin-1-like [Daktulosphaira vitifoliae]XP_050530655.1 clavesin-1-like [Daktulosphaira vitifoliae]
MHKLNNHRTMETMQNEWILKVKKEINEPENVQKPIQQLRELIKGEINLNSRLDDGFLLKFLRPKKFNVTESFHLIQRYYKAKKKESLLFNVSLEKSVIRRHLETGATTVLHKRDHEGRRVFIIQISKLLRDISLEDIAKVNHMMFELLTEESETQMAGMVIIIDCKGFNFYNHYKYLSPYFAKRGANILQDKFPIRFEGVHFVNEPVHAFTLYSIIKPFLKEKLRSRVHFHGSNLDSLYECIDKNLLPENFGGTLVHDPNIWVQKFLNSRRYFDDMKQYGYK